MGLPLAILPETPTVLTRLVGSDSDLLVREEFVEEKNPRDSNISEESAESTTAVELSEERAGREPGKHDRHVGQEVKRVAQ